MRTIIRHLSAFKSSAYISLAHFFSERSFFRARSRSRGGYDPAASRARIDSIDRYLSTNSSPFRKNICLGIPSTFAPLATTGPNGERFLESERSNASRRFLPHRQIIAFDFSLRFLRPSHSPRLPPSLRYPPSAPPTLISFSSESPRAIGDHSLLI